MQYQAFVAGVKDKKIIILCSEVGRVEYESVSDVKSLFFMELK